MSDTLQIIAGLIGLTAYGALIAGILRSKVEQSFAAFLLWAMLDSIATITTLIQHGNLWLPLSNASGSSVVALLLICKKQARWSWIETLTALLVVICLIVWYGAGETAGLIASSLAVVIASIPQMVETWENSKATPRAPYIIFLVANTLAFFAGEEWSLKERFYPACSLFLTAVILGFAFKKRQS